MKTEIACFWYLNNIGVQCTYTTPVFHYESTTKKTTKYELSTFNFLLLNSVKELSFLLKENKYLTYYYNFMYYYK